MEQAGSYLPAAVPGMSRRATVGPAEIDSVILVSRCTNVAFGGIVARLKAQDSLSILLKNLIVSEGDLACTHSRSMIDR